MSDAPAFSIIVPVYNGAAYLRQAVDSVLAQTLTDFELILVDDGSSDSGVDDLGVSDPRLRLLRQPNQGAPAACNAGLALARGEFVAFLDQDDIWSPHKLRGHLQAFREASDAVLTFTWTRFIGPAGEALPLPVRRWHGRVGWQQLFVENVIASTSSLAVRRGALDAVGYFDPNLRLTYDLDLCLRLLHAFPEGALAVPEVLTAYRRHDGQLSGDWLAMEADWRRLCARLEAEDPQLCRRLIPAAEANLLHYLAYLAFEARRYGVASRYLLREAARRPSGLLRRPRSWLFLGACLAGSCLHLAKIEWLRGERESLRPRPVLEENG